MVRRAAVVAILLAGCRGSGVPWRTVDAELEEKGRVTVTFKASMTGVEANVTAEGPAKLHFDREDATPTPVVPEP